MAARGDAPRPRARRRARLCGRSVVPGGAAAGPVRAEPRALDAAQGALRRVLAPRDRDWQSGPGLTRMGTPAKTSSAVRKLLRLARPELRSLALGTLFLAIGSGAGLL